MGSSTILSVVHTATIAPSWKSWSINNFIIFVYEKKMLVVIWTENSD